MSGRFYQPKECCIVLFFQRLNLLGNTGVVSKEMHSTQNSPVPKLLTAGRNIRDKCTKVNIPQHFCAAGSCDSLTISRDCGILIGQICVISTGIQNAQRKSGIRKIKRQALHNRSGRVGKIDSYNATNRGCHLIHETARLTEVNILYPLTDLSNLNGCNLLLTHKKFIKYRTQEHLECRRGGNATALRHIGCYINIQACQLAAQISKGRAGAPQNSCACVFLLRFLLQIRKRYSDSCITFALQPHLTKAIGGNRCNHININRTGKYAAMLMIRVITTNFSTARSAENRCGFMCAKLVIQSIQHMDVAISIFLSSFRCAAIQPGELLGVDTHGQIFS